MIKCTVERVIENVEISPGIFKLCIEGKFDAKPGQFFMLKAGDNKNLLPRPISVYDLEDNKISFLYMIKGEGTKLLSKLEKDKYIQIMGPLGNGFDTEIINGKIAVVTGGIGIAPMNYLLKNLKNSTVDLFAGFKSVDYSVDNVEKYVNQIYLSTESGKTGNKGFITDVFDPKEYDIVLSCGPEIMMKKVIEMCKKDGVKVFVSMENRMACGIGACLVCTCKTKGGNRKTCSDGPVFEGKELIFDD